MLYSEALQIRELIGSDDVNIIEYTYRKPKFLDSISPTQIDTIVVHNTSNYNNIDTNTDYHIDHNAWKWNGYGYYISKGLIYKIRGMEYQNSAVRGHNHHTVNIAIEGNYNIASMSIDDKNALEWLIGYLKKENDNIKYLRGHNFFGNTTCPGNNIDVNYFAKFLEKKDDKYDILLEEHKKLKEDYEIVVQNNIELIVEVERLGKIIQKTRKYSDKIYNMYRKNLTTRKLNP